MSRRPEPEKVCSCFALTMDADHHVVLFEHQPLVRLRVRVRVRVGARARVRVRARGRVRAWARARAWAWARARARAKPLGLGRALTLESLAATEHGCQGIT